MKQRTSAVIILAETQWDMNKGLQSIKCDAKLSIEILSR